MIELVQAVKSQHRGFPGLTSSQEVCPIHG